MRRLHLFEIEDQPWCPPSVRDLMTDFLQFIIERSRVYEPVAPRLCTALARAGSRRIVDLCSGAGGPWRTLLPVLERQAGARLDVCLTDFYPNLAAFERMREQTGGRIHFEPRPVDATRLPERLSGSRTLFTAFHHFRPEQARQLIQDAVAKRQGIAVFEATRRSLPVVLATALTALGGALLTTPFIRPFRWSRLLWTYGLPLVPPGVLVDGLVSCLRTYTPQELRAFVSELGETGYTWEIGTEETPYPLMVITYLIGYPAAPGRTRVRPPPRPPAHPPTMR